jgi:hypothetical protein
MPRLQEFTEDHEMAIRDFIYFDIFEWHPTDHNFWILKKNVQMRRDPKSFQTKNKKIGGSVATIVHTLQLRHNKARLKQLESESEKVHAVMPLNEDNTNDTIEGQFDFKIDVLHMDAFIILRILYIYTYINIAAKNVFYKLSIFSGCYNFDKPGEPKPEPDPELAYGRAHLKYYTGM